jgi:hypothetical protein
LISKLKIKILLDISNSRRMMKGLNSWQSGSPSWNIGQIYLPGSTGEDPYW